MKFTSMLFAVTVTAVDLGDLFDTLPDCASFCVAPALAAVGCSLPAESCGCQSDELASIRAGVTGCLQGACLPDVATKGSEFFALLCGDLLPGSESESTGATVTPTESFPSDATTTSASTTDFVTNTNFPSNVAMSDYSTPESTDLPTTELISSDTATTDLITDELSQITPPTTFIPTDEPIQTASETTCPTSIPDYTSSIMPGPDLPAAKLTVMPSATEHGHAVDSISTSSTLSASASAYKGGMNWVSKDTSERGSISVAAVAGASAAAAAGGLALLGFLAWFCYRRGKTAGRRRGGRIESEKETWSAEAAPPDREPALPPRRVELVGSPVAELPG